MLFRQPVTEWVESFYARNGLSRERMGLQSARAFDREIGRLIGGIDATIDESNIHRSLHRIDPRATPFRLCPTD